jgi:hypothetical protein
MLPMFTTSTRILPASRCHDRDGPLGEAGELLGLVAGQDVETGEDGIFRIARRVAGSIFNRRRGQNSNAVDTNPTNRH